MEQSKSKSVIGWLYLLVIIAIVLPFFYTNYKVSGHHHANDNQANNLYSEVIKRKEIRAAYFVGEPYFIKDPNNNKISGIFAEVLDSVGASLGLKINWTTEVGFPDMAAGLNSSKYDIVGSGIWISAARGKEADFTIPVLYDAVGAYVRKDDNRFDKNLRLINSSEIKISTIDGEMAAVIAAKDFPQAQTLSLPQSSDFSIMLKNVASKKADVTFLGIGPANNFMAQNPGSLKCIDPNTPVRLFPTAIMTKKGEYEFTRMLDLALMDLINNGVVDKIIAKYEKQPNSHYRIAKPFRTAN